MPKVNAWFMSKLLFLTIAYGFCVNLLLAQDTSTASLVITVPGNFNSEIGCPQSLGVDGDWAPDCNLTVMYDEDGDGIYTYIVSSIPKGNYEAKIAINKSWSENYGLGGTRDGANIPFDVPLDYAQVTFSYDSVSKILEVEIDETIIGVAITPQPNAGSSIDLTMQMAHWVTKDTILWNVVGVLDEMAFKLFFSPSAGMIVDKTRIVGGSSINLTYDVGGLNAQILELFPHLERSAVLKISNSDLNKVTSIIRQQVIIVMYDKLGNIIDATGLQIPGVLDDLFHYTGSLGVEYDANSPTIRVWSPTAQQVSLRLFDDSNDKSKSKKIPMSLDWKTGVWSVKGTPDWTYKYYLFEVKVYVPGNQQVQTYLVTDPYSVSLATNSSRSQIVNLNDPNLIPENWLSFSKPFLEAPEDAVIYELHVRDFSINDLTVPESERGTFKAFTKTDTNGMKHLAELAKAGLTHIHLLPVADIATIDEDKSNWMMPDIDLLSSFAPDSDAQQALIEENRERDGYNWGYDPFHFNVPEGSYSTDPDGWTRILEFRQMVQALNQIGLRVVMDVVYNHTNSSGGNNKSVLDKIVPGYYHRLNSRGGVETSTCCQNTATEHWMMEKLMIDSLVLWATVYKVDGFRFDLMGHHMKLNIEHARNALNALTLEENGVDGPSIYLYGEGWDFGEVKDNSLGINATQLNMAGTGVGTFNDRMRDAIRGGSPFAGYRDQGFAQGLFVDPNGLTSGSLADQQQRLLMLTDQIRIGLAGNLSEYSIVNMEGDTIDGRDISYNGQPTGYTRDPQENIVYVSAHDNETLFDAIQVKAPAASTLADRVRMQNLANSLVLLSQGIPFIHAGDELLRSKSGDRNSFNSGDWFNRLDFTYKTNNWGVGLPPLGDNQANWPVLKPLLSDAKIRPSSFEILSTKAAFLEMLEIRKSSRLFRLRTGNDVQRYLGFQNTGKGAIPGLIVMTLSDNGSANIDSIFSDIVVFFNANPQPIEYLFTGTTVGDYELHPVQLRSSDPILREAKFDPVKQTFHIPGRSTVVFVIKGASEQ